MQSQDIQSYLTSINSTYTLTKIESTDIKNADFTAIENTGYSWTANVDWNGENTMYITDAFLENTLLWIFPIYIPELIASDWQHRLSFFMESQLPIHITAKPMYASATNLKELIPLYVNWYNANIYNGNTEVIDPETLTTAAANLIPVLIEISKNKLPINA
jgi:hypothetical protein